MTQGAPWNWKAGIVTVSTTHQGQETRLYWSWTGGGGGWKGPKTVTDLKRVVKRFPSCVILASGLKKLLIRTPDKTHIVSLDSDAEYSRIARILEANNVGDAKNNIELIARLEDSIDAIPSTTDDFENRGLFSTHYLRNRIFDDAPGSEGVVKALRGAGTNVQNLLKILGWEKTSEPRDGPVSVIITGQENFSIRKGRDDVAPSYLAVSALSRHRWVILTNGTKWRLYTSRVSASTTNYFEISLAEPSDTILRYLGIIFGHNAFSGDNPKIDLYFDQGKEFATQLEENLAFRIMSQNGVLLNLAKGILNHDMKIKFNKEELDSVKENALRIIYRIWFCAYAESRNLLPASDSKYKGISLRLLRDQLDKHESDPDEQSCWKYLLVLFRGIRNGSPEHNLPQYNGELFGHTTDIDDISISNRWLVPALSDLLLRDGDAIDYASLSVRHLGGILESVMEFSIQQAKENIMLLVKNGKITQVRTAKESNYSYKKNDLYLASKGGLVVRKSTASYYTPDEIVKFLVRRGLEPVLADRSSKIGRDVASYVKNPTPENRSICMERLLDIQVLDPTMGSGHFLVEALNRLTAWATEILKQHPSHPLLKELEHDRKTILAEQDKKNVSIDENLLTHDVLLKRKIMKRCIFGIDLNPMATEIAKLALWLDSFAIGTPLTYLNAHIKTGDSTIGTWFNEIKSPKNHTVDEWVEYPQKPSQLAEKIGHNADVTVSQVQDSRIKYEEYLKHTRQHKMMLDALAAAKIDPAIIPKKSRQDVHLYLKHMADAVSGKTKNPDTLLVNTIQRIRSMADTYKFFHWDLEMMDAFTDKRKGFDLIIGNPPWNKVRSNKNEFFSGIVPGYKNKSPKEKKKIEKEYDTEFQEYKKRFDEQKLFYKTYGGMGENTDFDLWRIVMERALSVLSPNGVFSMLIPSAITNSRAATGLRRHVLSKNILSLYVFENSKGIFPIHKSQRFVLLSFQNAKGPDEFRASFYLHSLDVLIKPMKDLLLSKRKIRKISPKMAIIYETKNKKDLQIIEKLASRHPRLEDIQEWSVDLGRELNVSEPKDKKLLVESGGWPVMESKDFHQHLSNFATPQNRADIKRAIVRTNTIKKFHGQSKLIHKNPRLVYRQVSGSTNTRTMIACIVPQSVFTTISTFMAIPRIGMFVVDSTYHRLNAYLCGIFNSTTYDYMMRHKVDKHVETYLISDTQIPDDVSSAIPKRIASLSAILALSEAWHEEMADAFTLTRHKIGRVTLGKRIEIVAEIDALAALHYGLTRAEYEHVLTSFNSKQLQFSSDKLSSSIEYQKMQKSDRDKHMRIFYGNVYPIALDFYNQIMNKSRE